MEKYNNGIYMGVGLNGANESNLLSSKTTSDVYVYDRNVRIYEQMNEFAVSCSAAWKYYWMILLHSTVYMVMLGQSGFGGTIL